jgi:hypothetical protein
MHEQTDQSYGMGTSAEKPSKLHSRGSKEEDPSPEKGSHHAFVAINSSFDSCIIDSNASHHMAAKRGFFTSLISC